MDAIAAAAGNGVTPIISASRKGRQKQQRGQHDTAEPRHHIHHSSP
ncbi:MAG TPA: hypothetical protein VFO41_14860 [Alphaproteobacteria bacterium]|nr:hypothetical protein [Alphaproteobacteria bacterium]